MAWAEKLRTANGEVAVTGLGRGRWLIASVAAVVLGPTGCVTSVAPVRGLPSRNNILSPSSRTLRPVAVAATRGQVVNSTSLLRGEATELQGQGSYVVLDFGKEVGGIISLQFGDASDSQQAVGLAFSESSLYTGMESDHSDSYGGGDGYLPVGVVPNGKYVVPTAKLRGGFRYLTIGLLTGGSVEITGVSLQFTAAPTMHDLRSYMGSFQSNDDLLNRIWYAGAYTVQMDTIDPRQGGVNPPPYSGWLFNGVIGSGTTVLVDGAKRDRFVWPGDLGISALTAYVSTGDTVSVKNDLSTLFAMQAADGGLPYAGPGPGLGVDSDTYHLWTLDAVIDYYLYSGDESWLAGHWQQIQRAVQFSVAKIDSQGLMSVNLVGDWGRQSPGGEEISANAILYHVLRGLTFLAKEVGDEGSSALYDTQASNLQAAIQSQLWDSAEGMYRDTPNSSLYPQDGNSLALWFGIPDSAAQRLEICNGLRQRWNSYGALTPERPSSIATFPGSMEVLAHFAAGDDTGAMDLMRLEWGYMLGSPVGSGSTFWEGYLEDGSFDYGGPVMSLAHGWATGPTAALTQYVAGVGPELSSSVPFHFIPHMGDLAWASAVVPLPQGFVSVWWKHQAGRFEARVLAPVAMAGRYGVPVNSSAASVYLDGELVWSSCSAVLARGVETVSKEGSYVYLSQVKGSHSILSTNGCSSQVRGLIVSAPILSGAGMTR